MTFLYFLPNDNRQLVEWTQLPHPLRETLAGSSLDCKRTANGPGGVPGVLFAVVPDTPEGRQATTNYEPDAQFWEEHGAFWLGGVKGDLPTPTDLMRTARPDLGLKPVVGRDLTLGDRNTWHVPAVGPVFSRIPRTLRYSGKDKATRGEVAEQYRALAAESDRFAQWCTGEGGLTSAELYSFAARCLGLNYHVGLEECSALGLFDTASVQDAIEAICGFMDYREQQDAKKAE